MPAYLLFSPCQILVCLIEEWKEMLDNVCEFRAVFIGSNK